MSLVGAVFGMNGRARRRAWWLMETVSVTLGWAAAVVVLIATNDDLLAERVGLVTTVTLALPASVRRGHDRNRPAAWTVAVYSAFWSAVVYAYSGLEGQGFAIFVAGVAGLYQIVDYGFNPGVPEVNRHGPPPAGSPREAYE